MGKVLTSAELAKSGTEHGHQRAYFNELRQLSPDAERMTFAIPNGRKRDRIDAGMLKAEGVKAGVPDVFCAWPIHGYAGLFLEMKKPSGSTQSNQDDWHVRLKERGYAVAVAFTWDEAINVTRSYFAGNFRQQYDR